MKWKTIPGFSNYEASDAGIIRSKDRYVRNGRNFIKGCIIKPSVIKSGYLTIGLVLGSKRKRLHTTVHRLVARTFISNFSEDLDVNHIDGDKTNNKLSNLEVITHKENIKHSVKTGLFTASRGNLKYSDELLNLVKDWITFYTPNDGKYVKRGAITIISKKLGMTVKDLHNIQKSIKIRV